MVVEQCHRLVGPVDPCHVDLRFDVGVREGLHQLNDGITDQKPNR
jgi:hypothetical protein